MLRTSLLRRACRARTFATSSSAAKTTFSSSGSSSSSSATAAATSTAGPPIVELREYALFAEHAASYTAATVRAAELRRELVPLRLFTMPETGGQLNVATHWYDYGGGHAERDARRAAAAADPRWRDYIGEIRPCCAEQRSTIFVEASALLADHGLQGFRRDDDDNADGLEPASDATVYEIRRYQLVLGYDTVPKFLERYGEGLPSKLGAAGTDPGTSLVSLLYSDVGPLNEVIEIWRHGAGTRGMQLSREAARDAHAWRGAIASIAELAQSFTATIHKPVPGLSPWR